MKIVKMLIAPLSMLFILVASPVINAAENPFAMGAQAADQMQLAENTEAKCGTGKCGESKCGASMKKDAKEGKCGEGKCGASMKKDTKEGKCGEGKCGASMKKDAKESKCGSGM